MKKHFVFIVNNRVNETQSYRGLGKIFDDSLPFMREHIFLNDNDNYTYLLDNENSFLYISQKKVSSTKQEEYDILLVYDDIDLQSLDCSCFQDAYVCYHSYKSEKWLNKLNTSEIKTKKLGYHESNGPGFNLLTPLQDAYINTGNSSFDHTKYKEILKRIEEWFGLNEKLNAALEFLHECLEGTPARLDILSKGEFTKEDLGNEDIEGSIRNLHKNMEGKKNGIYMEELRKLRDEVLKKAGITGEN